MDQQYKAGFWPSEVSAELVSGKNLKFGDLNSYEGAVYWSEQRPDEGGRSVIVRRDISGQTVDMIPPPYSSASRAHEYGGGSFIVAENHIVFANGADQDLYKINLDDADKIIRLTNIENYRFADMQIKDGMIYAVGEIHGDDHLPDNCLVRLPLNGENLREVEIIAKPKNEGGHDFYCYPRISPCGAKLAYMAWDLPFMPWQNGQIYLADLSQEGLSNVKLIAGGESAAFAPTWGPKKGDELANLYFVDDESGFGNLYQYDPVGNKNLFPIEAECGHPNWVFAMRSFDVLSNGHIVVRLIEKGEYKLAIVDPNESKANIVDSAFRFIDKITAIEDGVTCFAATKDQPNMVVLFAPWAPNFGILRKSADVTLDAGHISSAKAIKYKTGNDEEAYGLYYPPKNKDHALTDGELPPIIVFMHGGPTAMADRGFSLSYHYWTTRGFAILDVDYRGSFGYGRDYVKSLDGYWGIKDVEDAVYGVEYLNKQGLVDGKRAIISGGSAGGFSVLMALANHDAFLCGTSRYGVADLGSLAEFTHKFEYDYMDDLVGVAEGLSKEELAEFYESRSVFAGLDGFNAPTLFLQGIDDKVVPKEQSIEIYEALKAKDIDTELYLFEGEGHGFKKAETRIASLEHELRFYQKFI